jgi:hypothetical protein
MLDMLEKPHRSADEDKGYCDKAKNGSAQLLSLLRKHHADVVQKRVAGTVELEPVEAEPVEPGPVEIIEPDPIEVWAERQKAIPIEKAPWFKVEKDLGPVRRAIQIDDIIKGVAAYYKVSRHDILSERRTARVVLPRQIAMYLAKVLTLRSLPEVGRRMNRDHTTVLHAVRKIERLVHIDHALAAEIDAIKAELRR